MSRIITMSVIMGAVLVFSITDLHAGDSSVGADVNAGYVWRGITFNDGTVFQPWVDVPMGDGFGVNVWGNMDIDDNDGAYEDGEFSEVDITLNYTREIGGVEVSGGYLEYLYPHQTDVTNALAGTREVYLSLSAGIISDLSCTFSFYYDIDEIEDYYASLGLDYELDPEGPLSFGIGARIGYAGKDWAIFNSGGIDGGFHEYVVQSFASYEVTDAMSLGATVAYADSLDEDVLPDQDVDVYGGLNLSLSL